MRYIYTFRQLCTKPSDFIERYLLILRNITPANIRQMPNIFVAVYASSKMKYDATKILI